MLQRNNWYRISSSTWNEASYSHCCTMLQLFSACISLESAHYLGILHLAIGMCSSYGIFFSSDLSSSAHVSVKWVKITDFTAITQGFYSSSLRNDRIIFPKLKEMIEDHTIQADIWPSEEIQPLSDELNLTCLTFFEMNQNYDNISCSPWNLQPNSKHNIV